jgi:hypothetical protein
MYRNLDEFSGVQTGNTGALQNTSGKGSDHHGLMSHSNLFDRHILNKSYVEAAFRGTSGSSPQHAQSSSQSLFWNSEGNAYFTGRNYIVHSEQAGRGYVIGTQGTTSNAISSPKSSGSGSFTTPVDRLEGIGLGATLEPVSLYEDQLAKRLQREDLAYISPKTLQSPGIELNKSLQLIIIRFQSGFGNSYQLQQSSDLLVNADDWQQIGESILGNGLTLEWYNQTFPNQDPIFFRISTLP